MGLGKKAAKAEALMPPHKKRTLRDRQMLYHLASNRGRVKKFCHKEGDGDWHTIEMNEDGIFVNTGLCKHSHDNDYEYVECDPPGGTKKS